MDSLPIHIRKHIYKSASNKFLKFRPITRNTVHSPFFQPGLIVEKNPFVENRKLSINFPNTLKEIYEKYDDTTEFSTEKGWIFLCECDIYERYSRLKNNIVDIAIKYTGMGHVNVLVLDMSSNLVFQDEDGGSSPIEREQNYTRRMATNIDCIENKVSFDTWTIENI